MRELLGQLLSFADKERRLLHSLFSESIQLIFDGNARLRAKHDLAAFLVQDHYSAMYLQPDSRSTENQNKSEVHRLQDRVPGPKPPKFRCTRPHCSSYEAEVASPARISLGRCEELRRKPGCGRNFRSRP